MPFGKGGGPRLGHSVEWQREQRDLHLLPMLNRAFPIAFAVRRRSPAAHRAAAPERAWAIPGAITACIGAGR